MRVVINELDLAAESTVDPSSERRCSEETFTILRFGATRIIKLAFEAHEVFDYPAVTCRRNERYSFPALEIMRRAGTVEHGRRIAQSLLAKGGSIALSSDGFEITLPNVLWNEEAHEADLQSLHKAHERSSFSKKFAATTDGEMQDQVKALLSDLVYPFREHFIGYEADPLLDDYFFGLAYHEILIGKGSDTFHFATTFGGSTFLSFKLAVIFIMSNAMKHRAYVFALMDKRPATRLEDILTVSVETDGFVESLQEFINQYGGQMAGHAEIELDEAKRIFDTLSVSRRNSDLLDRPGCPMPPLIQCSEGHVIRPLAPATADDLILFMLNSLRRDHPRDYARAQQANEGVMQRSVRNGLLHLLPDLKFQMNVKLRDKREVLTDIDMVIQSPSENHVVLVQLKHQDPYGTDLATMLARTRRLNEQVAAWLGRTRKWVNHAADDQLRATFRIPKIMTDPKVSYMVIARHYAHSLRSLAETGDFVFVNWTQAVTAITLAKPNARKRGLSDLLDQFRTLNAAAPETYLPEPPSEWEVGDLYFSINRRQMTTAE